MTLARSPEAALRHVSNTRVRERLLAVIEDAHAALDAGELDGIVLSARRMACIYALARTHGLRKPERGVVLADRFLEMQGPPSSWEGLRLRVLDDSLVSGRTLQNRIERVRSLVGNSGAVSAEVVVASDELDDLPPELVSVPIRLSTESTAALNRDFASVFGRTLMPYFTDFPVSAQVSLSLDAFGRLLDNASWVTVDVTNAALAGTAYRTYSLLPRSSFREMLAARLGGAAHLLEICKIRVFTEDAGAEVRVRVVAIVSFGALEVASVLTCASALGLPDRVDHVDQAMGAATYLASTAVLEAFSSMLAETSTTLGEAAGHTSFEPDEEIAEINLGHELRQRIEQLGSDLEVLSGLRAVDDGDGTNRALEQELRWSDTQFEDSAPLFILGDDLVQPLFTKIAEINTAVSRHAADWSQESISARSASAELGSNTATLSLCLDVLNDLGFAVPHYYEFSGRVFRAYRPGEVAFESQPRAGRLGGLLASIPDTLRVPDPSTVGSAEQVFGSL
jgi:hypothetical protein